MGCAAFWRARHRTEKETGPQRLQFSWTVGRDLEARNGGNRAPLGKGDALAAARWDWNKLLPGLPGAGAARLI